MKKKGIKLLNFDKIAKLIFSTIELYLHNIDRIDEIVVIIHCIKQLSDYISDDIFEEIKEWYYDNNEIIVEKDIKYIDFSEDLSEYIDLYDSINSYFGIIYNSIEDDILNPKLDDLIAEEKQYEMQQDDLYDYYHEPQFNNMDNDEIEIEDMFDSLNC